MAGAAATVATGVATALDTVSASAWVSVAVGVGAAVAVGSAVKSDLGLIEDVNKSLTYSLIG
ncbi:hypothetical protein DFP93_11131 [Aneurinibacillus soli]|nr:hypothetical protein DFP93_11131 [Aneurinibacillus soli]